uniref:Uncharacterized protein n=1 Tax=Tanacetum cinerariifolium TaxID=118510 RepID=A0A699JXB9_TANCI|nr:hypothetical protein [Tanacetum cinerariifolium]
MFLNNHIDLAEPFNDVYVTPVHTKKGEGSGQPSEPQPQSSTAPPSHEEQVTIVASQPQKTHTHRQTKRGRDTKIHQSSGPPKKVGDEVVYTGDHNRVVRAATTATSLKAEQESGNINKTRSTTTLNELFLQGTGLGSGPKCQDTTLGDVDAQTREDSMKHQDDLTDFVPPTPNDLPLLRGQTPRNDEARPNITEVMAIYTQLSNRVLALEQSKTAQDLVIKKLQKKVKRLEKKQRARTLGMNLFKIGDTVNAAGIVNTSTTGVSTASASVTTIGVSISTAEPRTPPTTLTTVFKDEDLTIAQTLVKMRSKKAKEKGVAFEDVEESARSTKILPTIDSKDKGKGIMQEPEKPPKNSKIA